LISQSFWNLLLGRHTDKDSEMFIYMLWSDVDFNSLEIGDVNQTTNFKFKEPLRFQIPDSMCIYGLSRYSERDDYKISLSIDNQEFIDWFGKLENCFKRTPWSSTLSSGTIKLKVDPASWIFNKNREIDEADLCDDKFQGYTVKCIVEINGVYHFKGFYGFLIRTYQLMYIEKQECVIELST